MTFPDSQERLARLDAYEGVRAGEYVRVLLPVRLLRSGQVVEAWAYVCAAGRREEVVRSARLIPSGDWTDR